MIFYMPTASAQDKFTQNFVFEMVDPSIRLNANHIFLSKKFLPCDFLKAGETMD